MAAKEIGSETKQDHKCTEVILWLTVRFSLLFSLAPGFCLFFFFPFKMF